MPIQCRMIDPNLVCPKDRKPGDMFYAEWLVEDGRVYMVSAQYIRDWLGKRPPLVVTLPNRQSLLVDGEFFGCNPAKEGWVVTGKEPNITLQPSIDCRPLSSLEGYHGWLVDGILSDDLEGRVYPCVKED